MPQQHISVENLPGKKDTRKCLQLSSSRRFTMTMELRAQQTRLWATPNRKRSAKRRSVSDSYEWLWKTVNEWCLWIQDCRTYPSREWNMWWRFRKRLMRDAGIDVGCRLLLAAQMKNESGASTEWFNWTDAVMTHLFVMSNETQYSRWKMCPCIWRFERWTAACSSPTLPARSASARQSSAVPPPESQLHRNSPPTFFVELFPSHSSSRFTSDTIECAPTAEVLLSKKNHFNVNVCRLHRSKRMNRIKSKNFSQFIWIKYSRRFSELETSWLRYVSKVALTAKCQNMACGEFDFSATTDIRTTRQKRRAPILVRGAFLLRSHFINDETFERNILFIATWC